MEHNTEASLTRQSGRRDWIWLFALALITIVLPRPSGVANDVGTEDPDRLEKMYWDGFPATLA